MKKQIDVYFPKYVLIDCVSITGKKEIKEKEFRGSLIVCPLDFPKSGTVTDYIIFPEKRTIDLTN